jgi:hypothetical protein
MTKYFMSVGIEYFFLTIESGRDYSIAVRIRR